eukprot:CAMPEP_0202354474 /NCGR_PEP_ID=MMETSP1126-20121109/9775_1 /ASSEMBLY_ACC=CAM_ASM_000457 /TAXON_ID=3047 /ORGANISM="Dunaliella tertiolecta, Strain CCMP1320" /LENGTH=85 /DNA_ID=CAMNT_0048946939 /DNA_START=265 /DNA_END=522 /DNA_ORIENTATION=-
MLEQENDHKVGQLPREELVANMSKFRGKKACRAKVTLYQAWYTLSAQSLICMYVTSMSHQLKASSHSPACASAQKIEAAQRQQDQ